MGQTIQQRQLKCLERIDAANARRAKIKECDCADRSWYGEVHDSACALAGKPYENFLTRSRKRQRTGEIMLPGGTTINERAKVGGRLQRGFKLEVSTKRDQRLVAVMCPYKDCGEQFPLKKRGDLGSYNLAGYDRHLAEVHLFERPKPVEVWGF